MEGTSSSTSSSSSSSPTHVIVYLRPAMSSGNSLSSSSSRRVSSLLHQLLSRWASSSTRTKLILLSLAGLSLSVLAAGVILRQRRRRYKSVLSVERKSKMNRMDTFRNGSPADVRSHQRVNSFPSPLPDVFIDNGSQDEEGEGGRGGGGEDRLRRRLSVEYLQPEDYETLSVKQDSEIFLSLSQNFSGLLSDDFYDATDLSATPNKATPIDYLSDSDSDSFISATQSLDNVSSKHSLYISSLEAVDKGTVQCRKLRTGVLCCTSDKDFLAKLHCVREALNVLLLLPTNRDYLITAGRDMVVSLLDKSAKDTGPFLEAYDNIIKFCQVPENLEKTKEELMERGVVCMNIYDVALDFLLLDAFDDLADPPQALSSALQNSWFSEWMKQSMLNTAVWSILTTKKKMLRRKDGFMSLFYTLSETISPLFAWGFLGSDERLNEHCQHFKGTIMKLLITIFSLESVRYSSVQCLAEDIMTHTRGAVNSLSDI